VVDFVIILNMTNLSLGVDAIQTKVIELYKQYVKKLQKGYHGDYSLILNMINFINGPRDPNTDNKII